jgi:hypothetical protein
VKPETEDDIAEIVDFTTVTKKRRGKGQQLVVTQHTETEDERKEVSANTARVSIKVKDQGQRTANRRRGRPAKGENVDSIIETIDKENEPERPAKTKKSKLKQEVVTDPEPAQPQRRVTRARSRTTT